MSTGTLRDVARRAGVSEMTVSRVLRNAGYAAPATRERVLRAASAIGYVPNRIAGSLARKRTNLVGVLVPSMTNQVFPEVLSGVASGLEGASLQPVFGITGYDPRVEEGLVRDMISWRPSGIAIAGLRHTAATRAMLRETSIPVAEMMDTDGRVVEFAVGLSHRRAGGIVAEHLIGKGYRSIAYVAHNYRFDFTARKRFKGFANVLNESGLSVVKTVIGREPSSPLLGRRLTSDLLDGSGPIDAIYYSNDDMAMGGLMHCLANAIRVPDAVALCGFSGFSLTYALPMQLTTVVSPRFEIGREAARYIVERLSGSRPAKPVRRVLPFEFVAGRTS